RIGSDLGFSIATFFILSQGNFRANADLAFDWIANRAACCSRKTLLVRDSDINFRGAFPCRQSFLSRKPVNYFGMGGFAQRVGTTRSSGERRISLQFVASFGDHLLVRSGG